MDVTASSKTARGSCAACNDAPTIHSATYIVSSLEAWFSDHPLPNIFSDKSFLRVRSRLGDAVLSAFVESAVFLRIASLSRDRERACTYRSQVVWEEADRRGIAMEQLLIFGKPTEIYRASVAGKRIYFQSLPIPDDLLHTQFDGLDDKLRFKQLLQDCGIAVSRAYVATDLIEAGKIFESLRKPVVVKPRIGTRARHTTTNVWSKEEFNGAFRLAKQLCAYILIEEHYTGAVSRATAVAGKMEGFLHMLPARVTGDGVHTIAELIAHKNATRPERVAEIVLSTEHLAYLQRSGLTPERVLDEGTTIDLSRRTGRFEGGATQELRDVIHPKLRSYVEQAARALRAPIVGFDIIIPDPLSDPDTQRWGFLEANSLPYIDLHYFPLEGKPSNVAAAVWNLWTPQPERVGAILHT
jgi:D-alanine-D-alanine ligase-like ATP-grasp enzyme